MTVRPKKETSMKTASRLLFLLALPLGAFAAPQNYTVDPVHSFPNFSIGHFGMATISGHGGKDGKCRDSHQGGDSEHRRRQA
jgi:hypothetical protein